MIPRRCPNLISQGTAATSPAPGTEAASMSGCPLRPSTPPKQTRNYGLYTDGKWYCNCKPRARAKYLTVKKSGPNKDRCFYSCADKDDGCDFFYWAEDADERAAAQGGSGDTPAATTPRPKDQSIRKYLQPRAQNGEPPGPETPSRARGDVMEIDGDESPSRPARVEVRQEGREEARPVDRPSTPLAPADRGDPMTPIRRPPKRRRGDDDGDDEEYLLSDLSPSEEEQVEQILSAASRSTNMSPPHAPAETPTRRPDAFSSTPALLASHSPSAFPTPSTRSSLGATRQRILDSSTSLSHEPTTPHHGNPDDPQPQTPNANTAASINADLSSLRALLAPHLDASVSPQMEAHLTRISMKVKSGSSQREMLRGALDKRKREVATLMGRNAALEDEVRRLKESRARARGKMLEVYKDT